MKKKISFIILGLILISLFVYGGVYFFARSRPLVESPCQVKIDFPLLTNMILGWQVFLHGEIIELTPEKLVILSPNKVEVASVKLIPEGRFKTIYQDTSRLLEGKDQGFIGFEDLKIGDRVTVRAGLSAQGDQYFALLVLKSRLSQSQ